MREHVAEGHALLACRSECRPHGAKRRVGVEHASPDESGDSRRDEPLADREDVDQRPAIPGRRLREVAPPAPQVDDHDAVHDDTDRAPELVVQREVLRERVAHGFEAHVDGPIDQGLVRHPRKVTRIHWRGLKKSGMTPVLAVASAMTGAPANATHEGNHEPTVAGR